MKTIYIVRHGQKVNQPGDPSLTQLGKQQAVQTGIYFQNLPVDLIYCSPSLRTRQTATAIADSCGATIELVPLITERSNWGDVEGQSFDNFWKEWIASSRDRKYQPTPGISSWENGQRFHTWLTSKVDLPSLNNIVIVSHGGTIGDGLRTVFGDDKLTLIHETDGNTYLDINECSITTLKYDGQMFQLEQVNQCGHLTS